MRSRQSLGFVVFCLLAASQWLVESAFPSTLSALLSQAIHYGLIAAVAFTMGLVHRCKQSFPIMRVALASFLLLGIPTLISARAQTQTALFSLVPLCIVVGVSSFAEGEGHRAAMLPALAGLTGVLLILPFELPSTMRSGLLFALMLGAVLSTAVGSVWMHALLRGHRVVDGVAVASGVTAICLVLVGVGLGPRAAGLEDAGMEAVRGLLFDLPQMFLLLWLLREIKPSRFAARFLAVPLLTVSEGLILFHGPVDTRLLCGLALLLVGTGALLLGRPEGDARPGLGL